MNTTSSRLRGQSAPQPPPRYFTADASDRAGSSPRRSRRTAVPPPAHRADLQPQRLPRVVAEADWRRNVIVCVAASGGVGLSVIASMLALTLSDRGLACALVDADCAHGGLDVLLGLEGEQGMRMSDIEAPLGRLEGDALLEELPQWQGVHVLGADPWNGIGQWWEVQAAVTALTQVRDAVVVDAGRGEALEHVALLASSPRVIVADMTVLGVVRAAALAAQLRADCPDAPLWALGVRPRGAPARSGGLDARQAGEHLGMPLVGEIRPKPMLAHALLDGLGLPAVPREYRRTMHALASQAQEAIGHAPA